LKIVRSRSALVAFLLALALPFALVACGSEDGGEDTDTQAQETPAEEETTPAEEETPAETEGESVHVVAKDFKFEGIPAKVDAGAYVVHLQNEGKEPHELLIFRKTTDTPTEELLKMPQKKAMKEIKIVGGTFAKPGEGSEKPLEAEFEAGDHVAVCFVTNKKGPHAFQGMVHEFVVE
jgi:hypothetical protein